MSQGAYLITLIDRPWRELSDDEKDAFTAWLVSTEEGVNLYTLLRSARRGSKPSSLTNMAPVKRGAEE